MNRRKFQIVIILSFIAFSCMYGQSSKDYDILLEQTNNESFPKVLIYDAPVLPINYVEYKKLGFDYISVYSLKDPKSVPNDVKYILWTGVASNDAKSKWSVEKSPFVDDIGQYAKRWNDRLNYYMVTYNNPKDKDDFGIIVLDIESKKNSAELEKERDIVEYKTKMEKLYRYPLEFAKSEHNNYKIWSSYSDVPVERNWWGIPKKTWAEWTSDPSHLNYITHSNSKGRVTETEFSNQLDVYTVSSYFFYNPEFYNPKTANQYLGYLLFQLEANQAWTEKPVYLYYTFKYQASEGRGTLINKEMVKNSVIFAFLSGADGIVLYDDSRKATSDSDYHLLLRTFIESISELQKYSDYFIDKNVFFYKPDNARDLFTERKYIVRGIEKNNKLLLAATNPFAKNNEVTRIPIYYKGKFIDIRLKGKELFLEEFIL